MQCRIANFVSGAAGLGVMLIVIAASAAQAASQTSYLTVTNLASSDIVNTQVTEIDNFDWADSNRPDHNFQGKTIAAGSAFTAQEDMNGFARSSWYTLQITFRNGDSLTFRNDQKDSLALGLPAAYYRTYAIRSGAADKYMLVQYAGGDNNNFAVIPNVPTTSWMSLLPDSTQISSLTIPGTHDSSTWNTSLSFAKTQNRTFSQQLADGIRFWDIRVRRVKDNAGNPAWAIHHADVYLNLNFNDVLNAIQSFLTANPTETLIVSIKQDEDPMPGVTASNSQIFWSYVKSVPGVAWHTGTDYPTLGAVRSVVLLRRYGKDPGEQSYGLDASDWPDKSAFTISNPPLSIGVQDIYQAGGPDKIKAVISEMLLAHDKPSPQWLFINFISDSTGSCLTTPSICAAAVMPFVRATPITRPSKTRLGITLMDFYDEYAPFLQVLLGTNTYP